MEREDYSWPSRSNVVLRTRLISVWFRTVIGDGLLPKFLWSLGYHESWEFFECFSDYWRMTLLHRYIYVLRMYTSSYNCLFIWTVMRDTIRTTQFIRRQNLQFSVTLQLSAKCACEALFMSVSSYLKLISKWCNRPPRCSIGHSLLLAGSSPWVRKSFSQGGVLGRLLKSCSSASNQGHTHVIFSGVGLKIN